MSDDEILTFFINLIRLDIPCKSSAGWTVKPRSGRFTWNVKYYCSIALQMEHLFFGSNSKSKMGTLNVNRKINLNEKTLIKNIFLKFVYVFINAVIGWNLNILNVLCQITFPSSTLSDMDQWLSAEQQYISGYWLALLFISLVNNISVISNRVTKTVTQKKGNIYRCLLPKKPS